MFNSLITDDTLTFYFMNSSVANRTVYVDEKLKLLANRTRIFTACRNSYSGPTTAINTKECACL